MILRVLLVALFFVGGGIFDSAEAQVKKVRYRTEVVDIDGNQLGAVRNSTHSFFVDVYVEDLRPEPSGVFTAFLDVFVRDVDDDSLTQILAMGSVGYSSLYPNSQSRPRWVANEIGAVSEITSTGGGEKLLCAIQGAILLQAGDPKCVNISPDPAETRPTVLHGSPNSVSAGEIDFKPYKLVVVPFSEMPPNAPTATNARMGDLNFDQNVDGVDLGLLLANIFKYSDRWIDGDLNCDGVVDVSDLGLLLNNMD